MSNTYLNPTIIALDALDFTKMDIAPGSAAFADAHFAIANYGALADLAISVNRVTKQITKAATSAAKAVTTDNSLIVSDEGVYSIGTLTEVKASYHGNFFTASGASEDILCGAVFSMMVKTIFVDSDLDFTDANLDFSSAGLRATNIFFYNESSQATSTLAGDVDSKTLAAFNTGASAAGTWTDEMEYWSYRTQEVAGEESSAVPFTAGDKLWCLYTLTTNFLQQTADGVNPVTYESGDLDAITTNGVQVSAAAFTPFSNASVAIKFALEWGL